MFKCRQCGQCCRNLDKSELYAEMDKGDGTCKYLVGNLCSIYENRPLLCRIDESYSVYFKDIYSLDEYYRLNQDGCAKMQSR